MGTIKCLKDSLIDSNRKFLDVSNWRYLREGTHYDEPGTFMVLANCRLFFIGDLSIKEIHNINYKDLTITKLVIHIRNFLCCPDCDGVGSVDWIQNATKSNPKERYAPSNFYQFTRDKKGLVKKVDCKSYKKITLSSPVKNKDMHYCTTCCGCGLRIGKAVVTKEFFLEKS